MNTYTENIIQNAFDFFEEALELFDEEEPRKFKFVVLHTAICVELILKARLQKEHWSLISTKPDKAKRDAFDKGDFQSVNINEALDRLKKISSIDLSQHQPIIKKKSLPKETIFYTFRSPMNPKKSHQS
ncbi:hypothetical protein UR09_02475 [Candidatus Nitromaritima sp. SCGC AAA799-A02]|nr:hypothetical protein UZ36_03270 [Candidatus Nitromaritima sp. SCGC AAA799-C22]KMP11850.1 hypothetical protein UR09_02475 [Candidatus Nitromaritima sp. SCGC AAA799-A02]